MRTRALHARLHALGFKREGLGGNCEGFTCPIDAIAWRQVYTPDLALPDARDREVHVATCRPDEDEPSDLQVYPSLHAAIEALENEPRCDDCGAFGVKPHGSGKRCARCAGEVEADCEGADEC